MECIFKRIKNKFQQLKKPTQNTKEIIMLSLWILGIYVGINLLPVINNLLLKLPSGLFLVLLLNIIIIFWFSIKTFFDALAIKEAVVRANSFKTITNGIYTINQSLYIGFNIYELLCLTVTH